MVLKYDDVKKPNFKSQISGPGMVLKYDDVKKPNFKSLICVLAWS